MSQISYSGSGGGGGGVDTLVVATDSGNASPAAGLINLITPGGGTQGVRTSAAGSTITVTVTPAGVSDTGTTVDTATTQLINFPLGAVPGVYTFDMNVAGFDSATPGGVGYNLFATVRTTGSAATLIGASTALTNEEAGFTGANASVTVNVPGNTMRVSCLGAAGKTINWAVNGVYVFAS